MRLYYFVDMLKIYKLYKPAFAAVLMVYCSSPAVSYTVTCF